MSHLRTLQTEFQQAILTGAERFAERIEGTDRLDAEQRLDIYADAYRARLTEGLSESYDGLRKLLGDGVFNKLCLAFIEHRSPSHYSIRWYGTELAEFLQDTPPWQDTPYLAELARFEWSLMDAFDSANAEAVTEDQVAAIPSQQWPQMQLTTHPSLRVLSLEWQVPPLWRQLDSGEQADPPQRADRPIDWLVWRRGLENRFRSATASEAAALRAVLRGASFGELCELLCEHENEDRVALLAASMLKAWISDQMIVSLEV